MTTEDTTTPDPTAAPERELDWDTTDVSHEDAEEETSPDTAPQPEHVPVVTPEPAKAPHANPLVNMAIASQFEMPTPSGSGAPEWAKVPEAFKLPANKQVLFLRFRSEWTDNPGFGHPQMEKGQIIMKPDGSGPQLWRQCIIWPMNVADKRLALKRTLGDQERAIEEFCRQMIRAVDGQRISWEGAGLQDTFWNELGEKCRQLIQRTYFRLHTLSPEATTDFLVNCIAVRTASYNY